MTADNQPGAAVPARKQSLTVSTLWLMGAKAVGFVLGMAVPYLMVRRMARVDIGHYRQIFQFLATAGALIPFGFGMTAFYFFPREPHRRSAVCLNVLLVCGGAGLLAGIVLLLFPGFLPGALGAPALRQYVPEVSVLIPLWIVASLLEMFPVVNQEFRLATIFIVGSQVSRGILILSAAILFGTVQAIVLATILHTSLQAITLFWYLEDRLPGFWRNVDWEMLRSQLRYAAPFALTGVLYVCQSDLHDYIVSGKLGTAVFTAYSYGCADLPLIGILLESASSVMIGRVSELKAGNDTAEIIALTARVARKISLVCFPAYAFLMVTGRELITILYTAKYLDIWPIFAVNCTILLLMPILVDPICRAYPAYIPVLIKVRLALFIAMGAALWFLVGRFGPVAAIAIVVSRMAIEYVFGAVYYGRILGVRKRDLGQFIPMVRIAICSAVAGVVTMGVRQAVLGLRPISMILVCGSVFCAAYGVAILIMRIPTPEERQSAIRTMARWIQPFGTR